MGNSTDDSSAFRPELCPWDGRRLPREMYVKLVVVHITVIGAYAHLLHLRRERRTILHYIFVLACPLSVGLFCVVPPLVAIPVQAFRYQNEPEKLRNLVGLLIGSLPRNDDCRNLIDEDDNNERCSATILPKKLPAKIVRAMVVQGIIMAQCVTSIWLFFRRVRRDSSALYDERIFQLAVLGLCSSIISMLTLLLRPIFPVDHDLGNHSRPDRWWIIFSGGQDFTRSAGIQLHGYRAVGLFSVALEWVFAVSTLFITTRLTKRQFTIDVAFVNKLFEVVIPYLPYGPLLGIFFGSLPFSLYAMRHRIQRKLTEAQWDTIFYFGAFILGINIIFLIIFLAGGMIPVLLLPPFASGWQFQILLSKPLLSSKYPSAIYSEASSKRYQDLFDVVKANLTMEERFTPHFNKTWGEIVKLSMDPTFLRAPDWDRIWSYGRVPPTFPCPKAWKDPQADYLWWLA